MVHISWPEKYWGFVLLYFRRWLPSSVILILLYWKLNVLLMIYVPHVRKYHGFIYFKFYRRILQCMKAILAKDLSTTNIFKMGSPTELIGIQLLVRSWIFRRLFLSCHTTGYFPYSWNTLERPKGFVASLFFLYLSVIFNETLNQTVYF